MIYSIEVCLKAGQPDPRGAGIARGIRDLGIHTKGISVSVSDFYWLDGSLTPREVERIAGELLVDPVTQEYNCSPIQPDDSPVRLVAAQQCHVQRAREQHEAPQSVRAADAVVERLI